jgi:Na+/H+ antiporter NhaD/arsenite permease-like protein
VLWSLYALYLGDNQALTQHLNESLVGTAQIIFFLMGAMTIVEVIDAHNGFEVITQRIRTKRLSTLMWLVGTVTFFLSAVLDNLTTAIVMVSLMKKLLQEREDRLFFAGIIVIAANAGGAWSPIGDVTTTMLWIGGQVTALGIMKSVFCPQWWLRSSLTITAWLFAVKLSTLPHNGRTVSKSAAFEGKLMFTLGLGILVLVPVFKTVTGLPPFMGILLGLGCCGWWVTCCTKARWKRTKLI